ncbi:MAG TPA: Vms1/Ankzf1 family peptidyl-tRNA hydrolase [Egibacteraceae bacterium]|nr:Vms1/Ankzf1 family peptidyl-tRNA hydrolase [Egibacteraceae bacterium]
MELTAAEIRKLVDRPPTEAPVTSVYLNTDGARLPRSADYEARLDGLLRQARRQADTLGEPARSAVEADATAITRWVRDEFDRSGIRGIGLFSSDGLIFEQVQLALGVRNIVRVNDRPYVVPLEALLGRHHHLALAIIERDKARIFRYQLGVVWEYQGIESDVHGQHRKGGWSARRFEKNIEHQVLHHMKDTGEILLRLHEDQTIDALVLAGPHHEVMEFSRNLHPHLQRVVHGEPMSLPLEVEAHDLLSRFQQVEQQLVSARRSHLLERLAAAQGQAEKAARGIRHVIEAINGKRAEVLFVVEGAGVPGYRSSSGALALHEQEAAAYGTPVTPVDDLVDEMIDEAVRADTHIEFFRDEVRLDGHPVAALLRF